VSSARRSTAKLPSSAVDPAAPAVTDPLSAVVLASKLPPTVIGQITRTSPCCTRHVSGETAPARATSAAGTVGFLIIAVAPRSIDETLRTHPGVPARAWNIGNENRALAAGYSRTPTRCGRTRRGFGRARVERPPAAARRREADGRRGEPRWLRS